MLLRLVTAGQQPGRSYSERFPPPPLTSLQPSQRAMGVPRFYRWLAKRYPSFRVAADSGTQPHVDNLYLDLNGIVHQCARHDRGPGVDKAADELTRAARSRGTTANTREKSAIGDWLSHL